MNAGVPRLVFALASAVAVGAGAAALAMTGSPPSTWVRNPLSWLVGAVLAAFLYPPRGERSSLVAIALALAVLLATFAAAPVDGVHRWLDIGPLHINAAALVLPSLLALLARTEGFTIQAATVAATGTILVLQPDASQATAFAGASALILLVRARSPWKKLLGVAMCLAVAASSWLRPDTLDPVPEVEGIFVLAMQASPALAFVAGAGLALACAAPLFGAVSRERNSAPAALTLYFAVSALAPAVADFPVPLVGLGMSFPLGWWIGIALARPASDAIGR
ncbi:MAG TPA: hypothetical protein VM308_00200 [Sphingomicrobium sp.]|nr:hypothetical protein [Sphingomicrobium sp.]